MSFFGPKMPALTLVHGCTIASQGKLSDPCLEGRSVERTELNSVHCKVPVTCPQHTYLFSTRLSNLGHCAEMICEN